MDEGCTIQAGFNLTELYEILGRMIRGKDENNNDANLFNQINNPYLLQEENINLNNEADTSQNFWSHNNGAGIRQNSMDIFDEKSCSSFNEEITDNESFELMANQNIEYMELNSAHPSLEEIRPSVFKQQTNYDLEDYLEIICRSLENNNERVKRTNAIDTLNEALKNINPTTYNINWIRPTENIHDQNLLQSAEQDELDDVKDLGLQNRNKYAQTTNKTSKVTKSGKKRKDHRPRLKPNRCTHLYEFIEELLNTSVTSDRCIEWVDPVKREFRLTDTKRLAELWGKRKNSSTMSYDKMSRTLRYYQKLNILRKIEGKRLQFEFGQKCMWRKL